MTGAIDDVWIGDGSTIDSIEVDLTIEETDDTFEVVDDPVPYPQSDRLGAIDDERHAIAEFIEWAGSRGIVLASIPEGYDHTYLPISKTADDLVFEMYGIDPVALEMERRDMLAKLGGRA